MIAICGTLKFMLKIPRSSRRKRNHPNAKDFLINEKSLFSKDTIVYDMPEERSLDIDNELDFKFVKYLMENEL